MVVGRREVEGNGRAGIDKIERLERGPGAGAVDREPMHFSHDQIGGQQRNAALDGFAEQTVRLGMMLIAAATQCDPRAAIDEQFSWSVRNGPGMTARAFRQ